MPRNNLSDLRDYLFKSLEDMDDVDDDGKPIVSNESLSKAIAVAKVSTAIINTVKLEIQYQKLKGLEPTSSLLDSPKPKA